ncbi:MAG: UvrABC system protein C [Phycisphaerae bacterium]|nr:UvrABC system protein C [Phycisphaerae bacterium]
MASALADDDLNPAFTDIFPHFLQWSGADELPDWKLLPAQGGVYALTSTEQQLILLSFGENLRRILQHRWSAAESTEQRTKRADLADITRAIWWTPTFSTFETSLRFLEIAHLFYPQNYRQMVNFGPAWYLTLDLQNRLPHWQATADPQIGRTCCVGPFPIRSTAEELVHGLEDQFDLCRYHHILEQTPHGQACSYAEMGRCPAPCNGSIPLEDYFRQLQVSADFVLQEPPTWLTTLQTRMAAAAQQRAYEQAARLKDQLQNAHRLYNRWKALPRQLGDHRYLVVQRAGTGRSRVRPFFCAVGQIIAGDPVSLKEPRTSVRAKTENEHPPHSLSSAVPDWIRRLQEIPLPNPEEPLLRERMWLLSHFLWKRDTTPGIILQFSELPEPATLATMIREAYSPKPAVAEEPAEPT